MVPRRIFQLSWNKEDEEEDEREKREKKKKKSVGRVCGNPRIFESRVSARYVAGKAWSQ